MKSAAPFSPSCARILRAGHTVYLSAIAPMIAAGEGFELVGAADMRAQMQAAFDSAAKMLAAEGLTAANVVSVVKYTTDTSRCNENSDIGRAFFAHWAPCSTLIGVTELEFPGVLFQLSLTAFDPSR